MMIKCEPIRTLFTHCAKTGGSSITSVLKRMVELQDGKTEKVEGVSGWQNVWHYSSSQHSKWAHVKYWAQPLIQKGWSHIAVTRNPWERVFSMYNYWNGLPGSRNPNDDFLDLEGWLHDNRPLGKPNIMPVLEAAGPLVTDWFSFDTLEEDFTQFLISKGVESVEIPHLNKFNSSRLKWDEVWTRKAIHEIYEWHKVDIEYFGYPDNPFYPR